MKMRVFATIISVVLLVVSLQCVCFAKSNDIVILYENDVHCTVEGYTKLAALKNELKESHEYVGVVAVGDFIQGNSYGIASKGEYVVNLMNIVGYDAVTLGNHEFDYKIDRLMELVDMMDTKPVCCNMFKLSDNSLMFKPYNIVSYGDTKIAFVGVTTPLTLTSSSPLQFKDENGEYLYSFSGTNLSETIQKNVDAARKDGADYVIAITHLGYGAPESDWGIERVIASTSGVDVFLDAHSHSVIEGMTMKNKLGEDVLLTSTGTKFEYMGKLTISDGSFHSQLIKTAEYDKTDVAVDEYLKKINEEFKTVGDRKVGESKVKLIISDENGKRLIRSAETNLGNFCADAYRAVTGADVSLSNGGGIRANIEIGDITFNHLLNVYPYNNVVCVADLKGSIIKDFLELAMISYPGEDGSFPQMAGITFDVDASIPSSVKLNENNEFVGVEGEYRVRNIKIFNKETQEYEPIDLDKVYSFASHNFLLLECGSGTTMFKGAEKVENTGMLDVELLEKYIDEYLGGVVDERYENTEHRINFLDEYVLLRANFEAMGYNVIWTADEPQKIVVESDHCTSVFYAQSNKVVINDVVYYSDRMAYIEDGTTHISADCFEMCSKCKEVFAAEKLAS